MSRRPRTFGFTLIEVVVALGIVAVGMSMVFTVVGNATRNTSGLRDRTIAGWVALNQITKVRVGGAMPSVDKTTGDVEMAGQNWKYTQTVTQTAVQGMRRLDVAVRRAEAAETDSLVTMSGFVGNATLTAIGSATPWQGTPGGLDGSADTPPPVTTGTGQQ
jgi:general secretion pathway protein I